MAEKLIIKPAEVQDNKLEQEEVEPKQEPLKEKPMQVSMSMRKGLDGRLMINEHDHIDIVYLPDKQKVVAFAKQEFSDIIYETQNRFFNFLVKKGICSPESVRGGNVYGSLEAKVLTPKEEMPLEHLLSLNIKKWIDTEKPALEMDKEYTERFTNMLTDPEQEDSTELGEVPQEEEKGSIPKYATRRYIGGWWE
jgi:hypothetical protein